MNTTISKGLCVGLMLLAAACPVRVQAAYEDVGVSARATGIGAAYTGVADDVYAVYYNPAGLATLDRPQLATSYSKLLGGLSDNSSLQNSFIAYEQPIKEGRQGAYGLAWNYFTLDSLYRETSLYGSYGRALWGERYPGKFFGGASLKYLSRSLGSTGVSGNAIGNTGIATGAADPVLANSSKGNMDIDLGFLYRPRPRWTLGMMIQHAMEPNIAFSSDDTDKLGRNVKFGGSYKTPFSTLSSDIGFIKAPDGSTDKNLAFGAEKWLPTLLHGAFGVRGALALGSRSFRQMTAGVSYKIYRLQFDYGFALPLGGVSGTYGTHRMGVTFRFGRSSEAETAIGEAILENMRELAEVGGLEFRAQLEDLAIFTRRSVEVLLERAKADVNAGRFAEAAVKLGDALSLKPGDAGMAESLGRLRTVAENYPQLGRFTTDAGEASLYESILPFVNGEDAKAAEKIAYAFTLNAPTAELRALRQAIESKIVRPEPPVITTVTVYVPQTVISTVTVYQPVVSTVTVYVPQPAAPPEIAQPQPRAEPGPSKEQLLASNIALMEVALRQGDYHKVVALGTEIVRLDPANILAYKRLGTAYGALRNFSSALKALRAAYRLEKEPESKKKLRFYIDALVPLLEKQTREAAAEEAPSLRSPQGIERLYESGVELYSQGRLVEAEKLFLRVIKSDPKNVSARKALDRVQAEMLQGGKR